MARRLLPFTPAAEVLSAVLQRVDPDQELRTYRLWTFWNDEVGDTIARRARPARVRNGILFVQVATHAWMQELQFMKEEIRTRLNARLGAALVRDIYFVSGSFDDTPAAPPASADPLIDAQPTVDLPALANRDLAAAFERVVAARARRIARARGDSPH